MKRNKLIVGIGLLLISVFALHGVATAGMTLLEAWGATDINGAPTYGSGAGEFYQPFDVAVDSAGNVYVADKANNRLQKFDGMSWTIWGGFVFPHAVAVDSQYKVYVADSTGNPYLTIRKYASYGGSLSATWPFDGGFTYDIAVIETDSSFSVYVADNTHGHINIIESGGTVTVWGEANDVDEPYDIALDSHDNVFYVAEGANNDRIQKFNSSGGSMDIWAGFSDPDGIAVDSHGNVYVADTQCATSTGTGRIQIFDRNGALIVNCESFSNNGTSDSFNVPAGIAVDSNGYIYVADTYNHRILKFALDPVLLIEALIDEVITSGLQHGIVVSMDAKLEAALRSLDSANAGQRQDTINQLEAFINAVEAQSGMQIPEGEAIEFINAANNIINCLQQ